MDSGIWTQRIFKTKVNQKRVKRETVKMSDSKTKNVTVHVNFIYYLLIFHVFVPMVKLVRLIKLR